MFKHSGMSKVLNSKENICYIEQRKCNRCYMKLRPSAISCLYSETGPLDFIKDAFRSEARRYDTDIKTMAHR